MNHLNYMGLKQKSEKYTPSDLLIAFNFEEALNLARHMLINEEWDESLQEYATSFLEEIKKKYPEKWNSTWKYDAFLGYAYDIILKYEEKYAAYKNAFDKVSPPPPSLLVALASCCWAPGTPPITEEEAIKLLKQAIASTQYIEAVELLRGIYKSMKNIDEQAYWKQVLENIKDSGSHLPSLEQILD